MGIDFNANSFVKTTGAGVQAQQNNNPTINNDSSSGNSAANIPTSNNSGQILDSLTALGNYNIGLVQTSPSSGLNPDIADYLSANPAIAAYVRGTDSSSISRIGQQAIQGYTAANNVGL